MNNDIEQAYKDISELKMASGLQKIDHIKKTDPNNAMVYYIENYVDFFTLFIQEDEALYNKLLKNKDIRLKKIKLLTVMQKQNHPPMGNYKIKI